ncbi:3-deoxy-7-phosphoheptulonate synthase [bacterium]|nr:3-deoxy-7-phosphoheptulonate synthase [bacterium]NCQ55249.1 3-deoxy-7-phosphoheptulonate synthase [Candidatus Parcubacteria bacterium]NCS67238.1 3-deoxy-7-phosphoheptulonate synthase [Candidatus Peregrinibacteria bacterium]NCS96493.1 3-deoxy-7-phosphoheptulonate synthase [bacterium]
MSFQVQKELPRAAVVLSKLPLSPELQAQVKKDQEEIKAILRGDDNRKIMIIGPCSAWPEDAVLDYAAQLKPTAEKVSHKIKIVMRTYLQKPRTTVGWLGPINQPNPFEEPDLETGTYYCREMMIKAVEMGYALADEALFTHNDSYYVDLLSWIAIGARSAEDQEHRIFASMIEHPVGLKNPTSGDLNIAVNSVIAAQYSHVFAFHGQQIKTDGNPYAHLILRGGGGFPNHDLETLITATQKLADKNIKNPSIIVDLSHDNSLNTQTGKKDPDLQPQVLAQVLKSMKDNPEIANSIKGFMAESFIKSGKQDATAFNSPNELNYGQSITDGCLGIEETKQMLEDLAETL